MLIITVIFVYNRFSANQNVSLRIKRVDTYSNKPNETQTISEYTNNETEFVDLKIPKRQRESFTLLVKNDSEIDLNNVTVKKSNLVDDLGNKITSNYIDERVVYSWNQREINWANYASNSTINLPVEKVDELLLKTDNQEIDGPNISTDPSSQPNMYGQFGQLKPTNIIETKIKKGEEKKFYFTVYAPAKTNGIFVGNIAFYNNKKLLKSVKIKVEVLKYSLSDETSQYPLGCFINDRIQSGNIPDNFAHKHYFITSELFRSRLNQVHKMGCSSLVLRIGNHADNVQMIKTAIDLGFNGPIFLNYYYLNDDFTKYVPAFSKNQENNDYLILNNHSSQEQFISIIKSIANDKSITSNHQKPKIYFYGLDEPNISIKTETSDIYKANQERVKNIKILAGQTLDCTDCNRDIFNIDITSAANLITTKLLYHDNKSSYPISSILSNGNAGSMLERINSLQSGSTETMNNEGYYFQGWNEKPYVNRYLVGFGFYNTKMKARYVNPVWGYTNSISKPLFVESADNPVPYNTDKPNRYMKQMMTMYPASNGLIRTLQSEAIREGETDLNYYLNYLKKRDQKNKNPQLGSLSEQIDSLIKEFDFSKNIVGNNKDYFDYNIKNKPEDFERLRSLIKDYLNLLVN